MENEIKEKIEEKILKEKKLENRIENLETGMMETANLLNKLIKQHHKSLDLIIKNGEFIGKLIDKL